MDTSSCRLLITFSALLAAAPLAAQAPSPIKLGQVLTGRLVQSDQKFSDGSRYKLYSFVASKGDTIAVDLTSDDFDANLVIADASGNRVAANDDSGENCNARLTFVAKSAGNYRIYANSSAQAELGEFKLGLARGQARTAADTVCRGFGRVAGLIEIGQSISGDLSDQDPEFSSDSTYFERWILPVRAQQAITVDLESKDFDAYVLLTRGRGDKLVENDDGLGGCNARLVYTPQDDHPLRIIVNTASRPRHQTGHFTLRVTQGQLPTEPKGNCRMGNVNVRQTSNVTSSELGSGSTIRVGETVTGALTSADSIFPDTTYFDVYWFSPTPGKPVTIDLASDDFDPMVIIGGGDLDRPIVNDDGGPGCASRVVRTFQSRGPYRIRVNTTTTPHLQTGNYTLTLTDGAKPVQERGNTDCRAPSEGSEGNRGTGGISDLGTASAARAIAVGESQQGRLTRNDVLLTHDSTYAQAWGIRGRAGTTITIDLEADAFDPYLFLRGPGISGGRDFQDADGGGNCNARLTATFPQNGNYEIIVNSEDHYATGTFSLSVTNGSKPKSVTRCSRSQ